MNQPNDQQDNQRASLFKGKSPRNALFAVGGVAAIVIAALGFYYQVKESAKVEEEAALRKKAQATEVVDKSNNTQDLNMTSEDQLSSARKLAASEARAAAAARVSATATTPNVAPALTADGLINDQQTRKIKAESDTDAIFASPIFKPGLKVKDSAPTAPNQLLGILTPAQVAAQQAAAQQAAAGSVGDRVASALAAAGMGGQ